MAVLPKQVQEVQQQVRKAAEAVKEEALETVDGGLDWRHGLDPAASVSRKPVSSVSPVPLPKPIWEVIAITLTIFLAGGLLLVLLATLMIRRTCHNEGPARAALKLGTVACFLDNLSFAYLLVDAGELALLVGQGAAFSGLLIGVHKVGGAVADVAVWLVLRQKPGIWRQGRATMFFAGAIQVLGAVLFSLTGSFLVEHEEWTVTRMLCTRALHGFGGSIAVTMVLNQIGHLARSEERPGRMLSINLAWTLGLGSAPLLVCLSHVVAEAVAGGALSKAQLSKVTAVQLSIYPLLGLLLQLLAYPSLRDVVEEKPAEARAARHISHQVLTVLSCLVVQVFRVFGIASFEAALPFILQRSFDWTSKRAGLATSLVFISCVLVKFLYGCLQTRLSLNSWLRILVWVSLLGSVLLQPPLSPNPLCLLVAALVLFPSLYMSGGLVMGIQQSNCLPAPSCLDLRTVTLVQLTGSDFLARGFAPPLARWTLDTMGQGVYSFQQAGVGIVALFLVEVIICHRLD